MQNEEVKTSKEGRTSPELTRVTNRNYEANAETVQFKDSNSLGQQVEAGKRLPDTNLAPLNSQ